MDNAARPSRLERLRNWIESPRIQNAIIGLIVINAITLGLETSQWISTHYDWLLIPVEQIIVVIFSIELLVKAVAFGPRFFRHGWNLFDLVVVGISWVPVTESFAILRSLRILRVFRLLGRIDRLRVIVESILRAIPSIGWIGLLILIIFYVFGVMGTQLFGSAFPEWFGTLGRSMYTLFQIMTLESWSMGISRPVMEVFPYAWAFFIPFILMATYTMLNLFIGIIVNTMQSLDAGTDSGAGVARPDNETLIAELRALREQVARLEKAVARTGTTTETSTQD